ncbi:cobaltochelatase subunit CobN [uncultured Muribaculum sp.]|uniref:cobaltochelatase subunit CobN n=1 Tax=uncultured Muribaculum sp. TaxID=1918613 RepID=UPI00272BB9EA|nr:cobaltochelatase subunit CobN [uncultured Muribaculum sp.]
MTRVRNKVLIIIGIIIVLGGCIYSVHVLWFRPISVLVVNALPAQEAEIVLNNDCSDIEVSCRSMEDAGDFEKYDAVLMYGRGLYLDSLQLVSLERAAEEGVPVFTNTLRNFSFAVNHNLDSAQCRQLQKYFSNQCGRNYRNLVRYTAAIAAPRRIDSDLYEDPVEMPFNMYYHIEPGKYFDRAATLTEYLKQEGLYNPKGTNVAFVSGVSFPVENNRAQIDTLMSRLTRAGYNIYPITATGPKRAWMIKEVKPEAIVYLPMGRLGNDSLINWAYRQQIPLFMPFPLIQSRKEWLDVNKPMGGGTLNARIVVPEIDGGMTPLCISTQNASHSGYLLYTPEPERIDAFMEQFERYMRLKTKSNSEKKIAIAYFKSPGKDALLASGMEVVPSLYNFLERLKKEGYDVNGLPSRVEEFKHQLMKQGSVMGSYAPAAQETFMNESHPVWINKNEYERWVKDVLLPEKYNEVEERYGKAPGSLLARGDSLAVAALRYGNILLFPQPRPALDDDDFRLVHGVDVPPPHSYIAPYLYMQKGFDADAVIHFGTHGNLEFTPGKNAGLSQADWAEVLIGNRPHFYFYTTGNVGEAIIAKRRSHAVIVTHLTPPYVESGMRKKYASLIEEIHDAIADPSRNTNALKNKIMDLGLQKDFGLDSVPTGTYSIDELKKIDSFVEELANEKITGAYYVMGESYSPADMTTSVLAVCADKQAYEKAKKDFERGKITKEELQDFTFIAHRYLPMAKKEITDCLNGVSHSETGEEALEYRRLLTESAGAEINSMVNALNGIPVWPAPGGDPVLNPNVLPMGRNMYSINAEATPGPKAWDDGVVLAEQTLKNYLSKHGEYPRKVSYTFWAGEFISSQGATIAQAMRMLGVEPVRDEQGRVMDLKLTPSETLGRPRINILVQVSGQLRDIAASRLKMLTEAVELAAGAKDDIYPNFVAEGTLAQEKELVEKGESPQRARELSNMRVFGPVNSGYSTGMLRYTESSGEWDDKAELVDGYLNNMCAVYGDDDNWGTMNKDLFSAAISKTDVIVQPRQSNTWGPISLDHVYEFTGALSLTSAAINGKEPDAVFADYRNSYLPRLQDTREAVAVETRATILNPEFIRQRMKGDATTAQMFGEIFRNIFGWSATRSSALPKDIYDDLYELYIFDKENLGVKDYFENVNPAAMQEMTATMLESARKGFWKANKEQLLNTASLNAQITENHGAPCTEFVCGNKKLQEFIGSNLEGKISENFKDNMAKATANPAGAKVLKENSGNILSIFDSDNISGVVIFIIAGCLILIFAVIVLKKRRRK